MLFSPRKFASLDTKAKHKKIAHLLRKLFETKELSLWQEVLRLESALSIFLPQEFSYPLLCDRYHYHLTKASQSLKEHDFLITHHDREKPLREWYQVHIYLDHLRSAHNIGNIIRTCEALRLGQLHFSSDMPNLDHPQVKKTSMGAASKVKGYQGEPLSSLYRPIIVFETQKEGKNLDDFVFSQPCTIVMGNEEYGVSQEILEIADHILTLPLVGCKNSLNVAACFAIVAWKIIKDLGKR